MLTLLRYIIQLILSPQNGWDDIADTNPDPDTLLRKGVYPLLGIAAVTEFLGLIYHQATIAQVLIGAVNVFGSYCVGIFIASLLFDLYLNQITGVEVDKQRSTTLILCGIGMMILFQIIENCLPWSLLIVKFLPLYAILVLSKGCEYLGIPKRKELRFTALEGIAIVAVPLVIYYVIYLLI